jgi:Uma2 family endonuclease
MDPARKVAVYEDLFSLPEDVKAEILGGAIVTMPSPLPRHSRPQRSLSRYVGGPFDDDDGTGGPGGWWILLEVDVRLARHDVVRPDLAGWRRERLPDPGDVRPIEVVPDWVCEILSPSTTARDHVYKRRLYASRGVKHDWLVDPEARVLEASELRDGLWLEVGSYDEESIARIPPFEAVEIPIGKLFLPRAAPETPG